MLNHRKGSDVRKGDFIVNRWIIGTFCLDFELREFICKVQFLLQRVLLILEFTLLWLLILQVKELLLENLSLLDHLLFDFYYFTDVNESGIRNFTDSDILTHLIFCASCKQLKVTEPFTGLNSPFFILSRSTRWCFHSKTVIIDETLIFLLSLLLLPLHIIKRRE